jgi:hypothetical protein
MRWVAAVLAVLALWAPQSAAAVAPPPFSAGDIISDANFSDSRSMSAADIQRFLEKLAPECSPIPGGPECLKDYRETTVTRPAATGGQCAEYTGAANEWASAIIAKVARACGISPRVILVTLQKEQSLVDTLTPSAREYKVAMGYGCPDTAQCDTKYFGLYNQLYWGSWQLSEYFLHPTRWRHHPGSVAIRYSPSGPCLAPVVKIENRATGALYNYTPYQPNAAARATWYQPGDSCSSYGNRNFSSYYRDWFGSPT